MKSKFFLLSSIILILITFNCCNKDSDDNPSSNQSLRVKFINNSDSEYTITGIELRSLGSLSQQMKSTESWGSNVLTGGLTIAPGGQTIMSLDIPNGYWSEYRLIVDDGGNDITVGINDNVGVSDYPTITHWGSDDRTVNVSLKHSSTYNVIYISSWADWAGIE